MRFLLKNLLGMGFLIVCGLVYFILFTETGLQTSIHYTTRFTSNKLSIQQASGHLFSKFTLNGIHYEDTHYQINIPHLEFSWNPAGLLHDKLVINHIKLDHPHVKITHLKNDTHPFNLAWLKLIVLKQFVIDHLLIENDAAKITFNGELTDHWNATWDVYLPPITHELTLSSFTIKTDALTSAGKISGPLLSPQIDAHFESKKMICNDQSIENLDGKIHLDLGSKKDSTFTLLGHKVQIKLPDDVLKEPYKMDSLSLTGHITQEDKKLNAQLKLLLGDHYHSTAEFSLPEFSMTNGQQPLSGTILFDTAHLELLHKIQPELKNLSGEILGKLSLSGTLASPVLASDIHFNKGKMALPRLGILLDLIHLHGHSEPGSPIKLQGNLHSGNGEAKIEGILDFNKTESPLTIHIKGKDLQLVKLTEYKIKASPDLQINLLKDQIQIKGEVEVPYAEIKPKNFGSAITLSSDVVFVDQSKSTTPTLPENIALQIKLRLGDDIYVVYNELQTYLKGTLQITQDANSTATATGEFYTAKGSYHTYGQVLKIQEGHFIFTGGPLVNPGLNIRAAKQVKTVSVGGSSSFNDVHKSDLKPVYAGSEMLTVGVQLDGTFNTPSISLFSNPSGIPQGDILSYLIFGYPQSQISESQNKMLLSAASALNFGGKSQFGKLINGIQDKLGLDKLNVESTEIFNPSTGAVDSTTSFVIGKQLGRNLYAHYSIGLFAPISILNLRYQLSKRFAIQSETSSVDNGADLLYSIERD